MDKHRPSRPSLRPSRPAFAWQALTLILALASPFGLYWGLQSGQAAVAWVCFLIFTFSMALTFWAG
jgi:hypothetical protein